MIIIFTSFLAGILSVLAPCVLPMIPILLWGWIIWDKRKPLRIIWSAMLCIFLFTYLLKISTAFIDIPLSTWSWLSWTIIWLYGLVLVFPALWDRVVTLIRSIGSRNDAVADGYNPSLHNKWWQSVWWDVLLWASLWPIFATCSPTYALLLGAVLPVSTSLAILWILAYMIWFGGFLYILVLWGRQLIKRFHVVANSNGWFKKILGIILFIIWICIATGYIKTIEANLISCISDSSQLEQGIIERFGIRKWIDDAGLSSSGDMLDLEEQLDVLDVEE